MPRHSDPSIKPLTRTLWWILFAAATYGMSLWFQTFKTFTLTPTWPTALPWMAVNFLLFLLLGTLIYDSYVQEKCRGHIQKPLRLFEWLMRKQFLLRGPFQPEGDLS